MPRTDTDRAPTVPPRPETPGRAGAPAVDCWIFDVDGCIVDSLTGTSLRPGAAQLFEHLGRRARVIVWSAGGARYAQTRAEQFGVAQYIDGYASKVGRDSEGHYRTDHLPVASSQAVFVDDRPEDLDQGLDVIAVFPYITGNQRDRGLRDVARRAEVPWPEHWDAGA